MLSASAKRFLLPFWAQKNKDPKEAAVVFAVAELNRNRGGGFLARQPQETLTFIAKIAYPIWLFPKNGTTLIFDGLNDKNYNIPYFEMPHAEKFMENFEQKQRPRENYTAFLIDHTNYFTQPPKEHQFTLKGLITEAEFREEFNNYKREATELTEPAPLLSPTLEETTIIGTIREFDTLQMIHRAQEEKLFECLRRLKKTTSQYITEISYEAMAADEEADAKIKAQEELDKPQTTKLNKEYSQKIKQLTESFDKELDSLVKLRLKIQTAIEKNQDNIEQYKRETKAHAKKGHEIYEKRWKQKIKKSEKEFTEFKKELKKIDDTTKKITKQKEQEISRLNFEWDAEIKLIRQPLLVLERTKAAKNQAFKQENNQLLQMEKPVVESIEKILNHKKTNATTLDRLGFSDPQLKAPRWVYVPFYVACYETDFTRRYFCIAPSTIQKADFGSKLKGAFGMSKTKDLLVPRFKSLTNFIIQIQECIKKNSAFERQLWGLGEKNNLLKNNDFQESIKNGLVMLQEQDILSQRETEALTRQLKA